jgi:hypothetical protein
MAHTQEEGNISLSNKLMSSFNQGGNDVTIVVKKEEDTEVGVEEKI